MNSEVVPSGPLGGSTGLVSRRASRTRQKAFERLETQTILRTYGVQADSMVATVKGREIDRNVWEAMTGQAMLEEARNTLANGDPVVADELRFFINLAKVGKGEIIADLVTSYCRESMR